MGLRDFLKGKVDKHGGVLGAARAAASRPARLVAGEGFRTGEPDTSRSPEAIRRALADLPTGTDADGFRAVGRVELVAPDRPWTFEHEGMNVAVFRLDGRLYAVDDACTHEDGPLGQAEVIDGPVVTCPQHGWRFDVRDGSCLTDASRPVGCWAVRERDGIIWLGRQTRRGAEERGGDHDDGLREHDISEQLER